MNVSVAQLRAVFGEGWRVEVQPFIRSEDGTRVVVRESPDLRARLFPKKIPPVIYDVRPVPYDKWPWWSKALGLCEGETFWEGTRDKGVGDTFHRLLGPIGEGYKFLKRYLTGHGCGCGFRRKLWNMRYRYGGGCCARC